MFAWLRSFFSVEAWLLHGYCSFHWWWLWLKSVVFALPPPGRRVTAKNLDTACVGNGNVLRATLFSARGQKGPFPVVLMRTPYGRFAEFGQTYLASHGFAVLVQDTRGRFGSDGQFVPVQTEREDGAATIAWVKAQPWYDGHLAVTGVSYLGFTAWACVGGKEGGEVDAVVPIITQSRVYSAMFRPGGAIAFELLVLWLYLVMTILVSIHKPLAFIRTIIHSLLHNTLSRALAQNMPLEDMDTHLTGRTLAFFQDAIQNTEENGPFWGQANVLCDFTGPIPPAQILTGWYDFFLEESLEDFQRARQARLRDCKSANDVRLIIGGFPHWNLLLPENQRIMLWSLHSHLDQYLRNASPGKRWQQHMQGPFRGSTDPTAPIQVYVLGDGRWMGLQSWPPPDTTTTELFLSSSICSGSKATWRQSGSNTGHLIWNHPGRESHGIGAAEVEGRAEREDFCGFTYDPQNPTPSRGGPSFNPLNSGAWDQRPIEGRSDVLVFTSEPLDKRLLVLGTVQFVGYLSSSASSTDLVVRLCDLDPSGCSTNICEGLTRVNAKADVEPSLSTLGLETESGSRDPNSRANLGPGGDGGEWVRAQVSVSVGPTACSFQRGHRIRLHVCSAAHPRWLRNLGDDEVPMAKRGASTRDDTCRRASFALHRQRLYLGTAHPSRLILPVVASNGSGGAHLYQ